MSEQEDAKMDTPMKAQAAESADIELLSKQVEEAMQRLHVPGVAIGVLHEGQEALAGFGVTSVENPLPVDTDTLFQIGSITKTYTATVAMRLAEMGKLDLDTPVRTYLPDLSLSGEGVAARVTLRHLFSHTAGWIGDFFEDTGPGDDAVARYVSKMAELPQLTPLGEVWSYCNSGFCLAGRVIEAVTGKTYEAVVKEMIFDPLGMDHSFFFAAEAITYRVAIGHTVENEQPEVARPWPIPRSNHAAGGIASSVRDQLRYARFHMGDGTSADGTRLLGKASLTAMQAPYVAAAGGDQVGVSWFISEADGQRVVRHGGGTNGQTSLFTLVPARQFACVVLTNANRGAELNGDITKWALKHYLGISEPEQAPGKLTEETLTEYAGQYESAMNNLEVKPSDGGLIIQLIPKGGFPTRDSPAPPAPPPAQAQFYGEDRVVALASPFKGARGEFIRDQEGRIAWLRMGGRIHQRKV